MLQLACAKNSFVLAAGFVNTMNLFALGDSCQNFYILLGLKICDNFASNYLIDLKLRDLTSGVYGVYKFNFKGF